MAGSISEARSEVKANALRCGVCARTPGCAAGRGSRQLRLGWPGGV